MQRAGFLLKILALVLISYGPVAFSQTTNELIRSMTLEQKVEQMMIFGFAGTDYNTSLGPRLRALRPGAFIVFSRNIKTPYALANAIDSAQAEALSETGLPVFFMVDQEGGQVTRIKTEPSAPSALAMGRTDNSDLVKKIGETTGDLLRSIGINMNLAPVLDIANPNEKHFIGNRSFSGDPKAVAKYGVSFSKGLIKAGVIPTAKHFPGHGGTLQDSHKVEAEKAESMSTLMQRDLLPFAEYSKLSDTKALMVAHVSYPSLDPSGLPATFSKPIITDLLRDQLGFNGLVITDDLEMSGASGVGNVGQRAVKAVQAGVDMVMVAWSLKKQRMVKSSLLEAIRNGDLSVERINDSLTRILNAKLNIKSKRSKSGPPNIQEIRKHLSRLKDLSLMVSRKNFEKSKSAFKTDFEYNPEQTSVAVFSADSKFYKSFQKAHPGQVEFKNLRAFGSRKIHRYMSQNSNTLGIYYATGNITARRVSALPTDVKGRLIVVNTTFAGMVTGREHFAAVIDLNTRSAMAGYWLAEFLMSPKAPFREPSTKQKKTESRHIPKKRRLVSHEK
jgi:beta-N-acetylhexosaminidase